MSDSYQLEPGKIFEPTDDKSVVDHLAEQLLEVEFLILVVYKGSWCQYCRQYCLEWSKLNEEIEEEGGRVLGVCSQTKDNMALDYEAYPFNGIADTNLEVATTFGIKFSAKERMIPDYCPDEYKHGMLWPGVIALQRPENASSSGLHGKDLLTQELYKWIDDPESPKSAGLVARPLPTYIWLCVLSSMEGASKTVEVPDTPSATSLLDFQMPPRTPAAKRCMFPVMMCCMYTCCTCCGACNVEGFINGFNPVTPEWMDANDDDSDFVKEAYKQVKALEEDGLAA